MWEFTQSQWNRKQNIGCKYWVYDLLFCKQVTIFNIHICPELRSSWTCKLLATLLLCQLVISLKAKSLFICFYLPNVLMTLDCNFVFLSSLLQCLLCFPFSQYFIIHRRYLVEELLRGWTNIHPSNTDYSLKNKFGQFQIWNGWVNY